MTTINTGPIHHNTANLSGVIYFLLVQILFRWIKIDSVGVIHNNQLITFLAVVIYKSFYFF